MIPIKRIVAGAAVAGALAASTLGGGAVALAQGGLGVSGVATDATGMDPNLVQMQGNLFTVPELTVPAGTWVTWSNLDGEQHDVVERNSLIFASPLVNPGETWALLFDSPGTYEYVCDLHANMEGVVIVTA